MVNEIRIVLYIVLNWKRAEAKRTYAICLPTICHANPVMLIGGLLIGIYGYHPIQELINVLTMVIMYMRYKHSYDIAHLVVDVLIYNGRMNTSLQEKNLPVVSNQGIAVALAAATYNYKFHFLLLLERVVISRLLFFYLASLCIDNLLCIGHIDNFLSLLKLLVTNLLCRWSFIHAHGVLHLY